MHIIRTWYGVRGSGQLTAYALRWGSMLTETAQRRVRILAFWAKHGTEATTEAFGISRSTLYGWQATVKKGNGVLEVLNPHSRAPQHRRHRLWPAPVITEIRRLRQTHPNLGKDKLHPELLAFCQQTGQKCPSIATVGRLIADAPDKMRLVPQKVRHNGTIVPRQRKKKLRKPKGFVAQRPGACLAFDTIERVRNGCRRYVITNLDCFDRFALALGTPSHASTPPTALLFATQACYPDPLSASLTDNGSEFQKCFDAALRVAGIPHWHTFPRTPRMNAHVERFNRTIQEEFIDHHERLLFTDLPEFNRLLAEYLIWYNTVRPHQALGNQSPLNYRLLHQPESRMWWARTASCIFFFLHVE